MSNKKRMIIVATAWILSIVICCTCTFLITKGILETDKPAGGETMTTDPTLPTEPEKTDAYEAAVNDAMSADADEIKPLVTVTKDDPMVTWNDEGDKVMMLCWNKYPESYPDGSTFECQYGEVWVFTDKEILSWYQNLDEEVSDWDLRLAQVIGLPEGKGYTHFTAFWVDVDELVRPAYQTDVTQQVTEADLDGSGLGDFKTWFDGNIVWSYFDSDYPWTRLGYTYDWNENSDEYGLTEFLILADSTVEVEWTVTTEEFLEMLEAGSLKK